MRTLPILFLLLFLAPPDEARRANQAYLDGDFAAAEAGYRASIQSSPNDSRLHFNLGNALARQGKHDEALAAYARARALSTNAQDRAAADYNSGHVLGARNDWGKAAERFRDALRANPSDPQAMFNYELARRMITNPPPQQQQNDRSDTSDDDQGSESQSRSKPDQQPNQESSSESPSSDSAPAEGDMTREEANQILNALENKEKDLLKEFQKQQVPPRSRHAKDW